jgi:DNA-binding NarL/FixJ family response regulator
LAVVSPDEVVSRGVTAMMADYAHRVVVTSLPSAWVTSPSADVVLYDTVALGASNGDDLDHLLRQTPRVLLYSRELRPDLRARGEERGCAAWVSMSSGADELIDAVERTAAGELVAAHHDRAGRELGLTRREAEVLGLLTLGLSNQEIADRLFVAPSTLKGHIRSAYRQIGVTSRSQAVTWAMQNGLYARPT